MSSTLQSSLSAEPDPAVQGEDLCVTYTGNDSLYYSVDDGPFQELPLDGDGNGTIQVPAGAESIVLSNLKLPDPTNLDVEVISTRGP